MNPSWDDASGSLNTIDLLSASPADIRKFQHVSEETSHCENAFMPSAVATEVEAQGAPSLLTSSSEQQNPVDPSAIYQINFDVEHLGKNKPQSKRMAIWKYGIPQESADGMIVADHEAKLTWSTHSGKYTISVDGEEVFTSVAKGSVLEHKWKWSHYKACVADDDEDVVSMRIIACRKPPVRTSKDFRCYEFIIGGKVFRDLPLTASDEYFEGEYPNEESVYKYEDGKLTSILDIVEPGWRNGFS
mmetsp:Transcript_57531/g.122082  ORF Transcript_57531/g.122082 Transcript_57531/m.122082 type:complete len:245 (-) Transcript_57531:170-904(-)|eukprot:CAMPEP_0172556142 /NCGR_PEP_ID=MMETSP1067-20121228/63700_1 /TAXON_ID=265564 ORGANISM="Thalassiosira punctigera, Strain Tpunct2005C2" /NCGR_SAMPLE_ID=MMETSP1067 /ASSEMBLY_ACC=CAM_ASM_000444 /LENGTH=244 /DNA_ID=CAMNT_0013344861 /DNA_START=135 /DNA_END=869 /DNA_ORIENTATION=-